MLDKYSFLYITHVRLACCSQLLHRCQDFHLLSTGFSGTTDNNTLGLFSEFDSNTHLICQKVLKNLNVLNVSRNYVDFLSAS